MVLSELLYFKYFQKTLNVSNHATILLPKIVLLSDFRPAQLGYLYVPYLMKKWVYIALLKSAASCQNSPVALSHFCHTIAICDKIANFVQFHSEMNGLINWRHIPFLKSGFLKHTKYFLLILTQSVSNKVSHNSTFFGHAFKLQSKGN